MKDRTGTTKCVGCRTYRVDEMFINVKGQQRRACSICRKESFSAIGVEELYSSPEPQRFNIMCSLRQPCGDAALREEEHLMILAREQQKNAAKAERKAARKAAERQKLAPVPAPEPVPEPTSDDDDYIELSKT